MTRGQKEPLRALTDGERHELQRVSRSHAPNPLLRLRGHEVAQLRSRHRHRNRALAFRRWAASARARPAL